MKLDVMADDIGDAYLQSPNLEKNNVICGPCFGLDNVGKGSIDNKIPVCRKGSQT